MHFHSEMQFWWMLKGHHYTLVGMYTKVHCVLIRQTFIQIGLRQTIF